VFLKPFSLGETIELSKTNLIDLIREITPGLGQSFRHTLDQLRRPLEIVSAIVPDFERSKERVIFQPVRLLVAELFKGDS
jgi:hypothetical protein